MTAVNQLSRRTKIALLAAGLALAAALSLGIHCLASSDTNDRSHTSDVAAAPHEGLQTRDSTGRREADGGTTGQSSSNAPASTLFARLGWGTGPGNVAHSRPEEANPEAPMSLAPGRNGGVLVLDQLNNRLVRLGPDGHPIGTTPLGMTAPQDIATAPDGTTAVLDRLSDHTVTLLSPDGRVIGTLPVEGDGIPEGGGTTAVVIDHDDVYVEREHGPLVLLGDLEARQASVRTEIPGRPTRDGLSYITAGIIEAPAGRLYVNSINRQTGDRRFTRELHVPLAIRVILLLDSDTAGTIYVAVSGVAIGAPEESPESARLLCLAPNDGTPLGSAVLPVNTDPDETMREMIVLDGGGVLYAVRSEEGVLLQRFDCQ